MGALGASAGGAAGFAFDVNGSYSVPILASVCDNIVALAQYHTNAVDTRANILIAELLSLPTETVVAHQWRRSSPAGATL
jgi:hypothetical protein